MVTDVPYQAPFSWDLPFSANVSFPAGIILPRPLKLIQVKGNIALYEFGNVFVIFARVLITSLKKKAVKNLLIITCILFAASSCSSLKPSTAGKTYAVVPRNPSSIEFINNISIQPQGHAGRMGNDHGEANPYIKASPVTAANNAALIENYSPLQFKYAILMDATVEEMNNAKLLSFIEDWYGTRYRYGGSSKEGIDCSAFVSYLMSAVYGVGNLPRISKDQYETCKRVKRSELAEGDLVFFHTLGRRKSVTHVGVYLRNNKFIHASISGVMISSMEEGYYDQHFVGAGRVIE